MILKWRHYYCHKNFTLRPTLKERLRRTRKWSITTDARKSRGKIGAVESLHSSYSPLFFSALRVSRDSLSFHKNWEPAAGLQIPDWSSDDNMHVRTALVWKWWRQGSSYLGLQGLLFKLTFYSITFSYILACGLFKRVACRTIKRHDFDCFKKRGKFFASFYPTRNDFCLSKKTQRQHQGRNRQLKIELCAVMIISLSFKCCTIN